MDLINNCTEGADRSILAREHPTSDSCLKRQGEPYYKKYITPQCILKITQETITYCITPSLQSCLITPALSTAGSLQIFCSGAYLKTSVQTWLQKYNTAEVRGLCRCN